MKNTLLLILFVAVCGACCAQQPQTIKLTQLETAPIVEGIRAGQIGLTNSAGKQRYAQFVEIDLTPIAFVPTATGNLANFSEFVTDPNGDKWYIDWQGRGYKFPGGSGADKNGYYGGNLGNGGDETIPSATTSTLTNQLTWAINQTSPGGTVPLRLEVLTPQEFEDYFTIRSGTDSLHIYKSDTDFTIFTTNDFYLSPDARLILQGDSVRVFNCADAFAGERTFVMRSPMGFLTKKEGIGWTDLLQPVRDSINAGGGGGTITTVGPIQGDGSGGDPVTFIDGGMAGDVWQWDGDSWELAQVSGTDQTLSVAANTTTLSNGGGSMTIAGGGINSVSTAGSTITVTGIEVDGLIDNEGSLTVAAGTGTTSIINSNTSGQTGVTLTAGSGLAISETGNVITLTNTAADQTRTINAGSGINVSGTDPTWTISAVDPSISNEGSLTVAAGTSNTSIINSNTSGQTGVTITAAGINTISEVGNVITLTANEVDGNISNEGSLTVAAGTATTSIINSNTSGSTGVTLTAGSGLTISETGNVITLFNSSPDQLRTINAGSGISVSGSDPTWTITAIDPSISNEGSLTVAAGTGTTSIINSNTSGQTGVTLTAGSGLTISETGNNITLSATGGSQNGYYGGNGGNGGDATIPSSTTSTLTNQLTWYIPSTPYGGTVPLRLEVGTPQEFEEYWTIRSGSDSMRIYKSDTDFIIKGTTDMYVAAEQKVVLSADSVQVSNMPDAFAGENTFVMRSPGGILVKKEGISASAIVPTVISPATITSDQDNYSPTGWTTAGLVRLSGDNGIRAITSFAATSAAGGIKTLTNVGSYPIYFPGEHPDGTAANRILTPYDFILWPGSSVQLFYDATSSRWRLMGQSTSSIYGRSVFYNWSAGSATAGDYGDFAIGALNAGSFSAFFGANNEIPPANVLASSTTNNGGAYMGFAKSVNSIAEFSYAHLYFRSLLSVPTLSDGTETYTISAQFSSSLSSTTLVPNNTVGIRYTHGTNSGKFQGFSKDNAGTESTVDLGVTVTANQVYQLVTEVDKANSEVRFYIDGVFCGRLTSNMPNAVECSPRVLLLKSAGTTNRTVYVNSLTAEAIYP